MRRSHFHRCIRKYSKSETSDMKNTKTADEDNKIRVDWWTWKEKGAEENWTRWEQEANIHTVRDFDLRLTEEQIKMSGEKDGGGVQRREMVVCCSYSQPIVSLIHTVLILSPVCVYVCPSEDIVKAYTVLFSHLFSVTTLCITSILRPFWSFSVHLSQFSSLLNSHLLCLYLLLSTSSCRTVTL